MKRVLFLCTGNSCRSQMAEAVLRSLGGDRFEALSAGTEPAGIHPMTIEVLRAAGYDTASLWSKTLDEVADVPFDQVVTLCDSARQTCPFFPGGAERLHWSLPDPAAVQGSRDEIREAFRETLSDIESRIAALLRERVDFAAPEAPGDLLDGVRHLSPREAFEAATTGGAILVDLRAGYETAYRTFDVPEVLYLPWKELRQGIDRLPRNRPLLLADAVGLRAREAVRLLHEVGFTSVACLSGGVIDWEAAGLPVRKDPGFELRGQCSCRLSSPKGGRPPGEREPSSGS